MQILREILPEFCDQVDEAERKIHQRAELLAREDEDAGEADGVRNVLESETVKVR